MPWCNQCERWFGPAALGPEGTCPVCGRPVAAGRSDGEREDAAEALRPVAGAPWHFKLLLAALALYLGFRLWQAIAWLIGHL